MNLYSIFITALPFLMLLVFLISMPFSFFEVRRKGPFPQSENHQYTLLILFFCVLLFSLSNFLPASVWFSFWSQFYISLGTYLTYGSMIMLIILAPFVVSVFFRSIATIKVYPSAQSSVYLFFTLLSVLLYVCNFYALRRILFLPIQLLTHS